MKIKENQEEAVGKDGSISKCFLSFSLIRY